MSLRSKIVLILATVAVLYVTIDVVLMRAMVADPFRVLEEDEAMVDVARVKADLDGVTEELARIAGTLAARSDTRRFLAGEDPSFEADALGPNALAASDVNLLYFCDASGKVVWGRIEESGTRAPVRLREFPASEIGEHHPIVLSRRGGVTKGMLATERGPMLVGSCEVPSAPSGAGGGSAEGSAGSVIVGRFFDAALKEQIYDRTRVSVDVWPLDTDSLPPDAAALVDRITPSPVPIAEPASDDELDLYATVEDIRGAPTLLMKATFDRSITRGGFRIFHFALLSTIATALLLLLVLLRLLNRIVIRPLAQLTQHTVEIGRTEDMTRRVAMQRSDELGQLSQEFDGLMVKLAKSRQEVIRTARQAGMSEIATGVLHNVGNVLNSVNVSANLVKRKTESLSVGDLEAMTGVLRAEADNLAAFVTEDERGKQFLPFLSELSHEMAAQQGEILEELGVLSKGVEHIMELVRSQQSYAGAAGVFEPTSLAEQLDAALSISEQAYGFTNDMEVMREYAELPPVTVDRHKLMEILVNVIQNAQQAMEDGGTEHKRLVLRLLQTPEGRARIEIQDNGHGIAPENLARIFTHGFTTRKNGHGFGLHISANAATEMKSSLWAESEGPGRGATFILEMPMGAAVLCNAA